VIASNVLGRGVPEAAVRTDHNLAVAPSAPGRPSRQVMRVADVCTAV
jgi:hypothetical protein